MNEFRPPEGCSCVYGLTRSEDRCRAGKNPYHYVVIPSDRTCDVRHEETT